MWTVPTERSRREEALYRVYTESDLTMTALTAELRLTAARVRASLSLGRSGIWRRGLKIET